MKLKSFDGHNINDGTNYNAYLDDSAYGIPAVKPRLVEVQMYRPVLSAVSRPGRDLYFEIRIADESNKHTLYTQLCQWFDPDDETSKKLLAEDAGGGNDRYVMALCKNLQELPHSAGRRFMVTLSVDGDVYWRENTASTSSLSVTGTGDTVTVANNGDMKAFPKFTIEPTSAKTGAYAYKRWFPVRWNLDVAHSDYPYDICDDGFDTATLVTAGKMQSDGDDLRVWVDGVEVDRWLDGINTATTKVFINLDFQAKQEVTLGTAIASSGSISTIDADGDISGFPSSGILVIDSEAFVYTGKSNNDQQFTGVTRAAKGTSMAAHTTSDTVWWVQHDISILYGNSGASAPSVDDDYKPAFDLSTSTNTSWDYNEFGEGDGLRTAAWTQQVIETSPTFYTANRETDADPWEEIGIIIDQSAPGTLYRGAWMAYNPCGITNVNFQNGEKYSDELISFNASIEGSPDNSTWTWEDSIAAPSSVGTWESWSDNEATRSGVKYVRLEMEQYGYPDQAVEVADVTLTLDSSNTPTTTIGGEQTNYSLACTITNNETGKSVSLSYSMALNEELEVDTNAKTVVDLEDDSNQFQALTVNGDARRDWLALETGNNELQYDETGVNGVTLSIEWKERFYG